MVPRLGAGPVWNRQPMAPQFSYMYGTGKGGWPVAKDSDGEDAKQYGGQRNRTSSPGADVEKLGARLDKLHLKQPPPFGKLQQQLQQPGPDNQSQV